MNYVGGPAEGDMESKNGDKHDDRVACCALLRAELGVRGVSDQNLGPELIT